MSMLSTVRTIIDTAPKSVAGISISNTHIRYIYLSKGDSEYEIQSYGEVKIPFDVVSKYEVILPVEFTEVIRTLIEHIPLNTDIYLRNDGDNHKIESLVLAGYSKIHPVLFPGALTSLLVPFGVPTKRIVVFGQWDEAVVFLLENQELIKLGTVVLDDLDHTRKIFKDALYGYENQRIVLAGVLNDKAREQLSSVVSIEEADYFQNLIDITNSIPAIQKSDAARFSVPLAAMIHGVLTGESTLQHIEKESHEKEEKNDVVEAADYFKDMKPLTKQEDDARRSSERVRGRKYRKMMNSSEISA